jgi:predicted ATPase/CYTH domain-containing protein
MRERIDDAEMEERRFLIEECDPEGYAKWPSAHVITGFVDTDEAKSIRVQVVQHAKERLPDIYTTATYGRGIKRRKANADLPATAAQLFLDFCHPRKTHQQRYRHGNMRVGVYQKELFGIRIIEFKDVGKDVPIEKPRWVTKWREVTGKLTSYKLAELAALRSRYAEELPYGRINPMENLPRLVLTGGPCSGKTTVIQHLQGLFDGQAHFVPEMATILDKNGITVPNDGDPVTMLEFQTTVARIQRVFEDGAVRHAYRNGLRAIICDRGEVDGGAYMKGGLDALEIVSGIDIHHLYERYDRVIYLSVPPQDVYDANKGNNTSRKESHELAVRVGQATLQAWQGHPHLSVIGNYGTMDEKLDAVATQVRAFLDDLRSQP